MNVRLQACVLFIYWAYIHVHFAYIILQLKVLRKKILNQFFNEFLIKTYSPYIQKQRALGWGASKGYTGGAFRNEMLISPNDCSSYSLSFSSAMSGVDDTLRQV